MRPKEASAHAGQFGVLQDLVGLPVHGLPPALGMGLLQVRVWAPPPQDALHDDHALQLPSTGQGCELQGFTDIPPVHGLPPAVGAGLLQVRIWTPPHVAEQSLLHSDQCPFNTAQS